MKKNLVIGICSFLAFCAFIEENISDDISSKSKEEARICDGIDITSDCSVEGVEYSVYKYYPAEEERTHVETVITYTTEVVGYCTMCKDRTRSPSCSTGSGTCSHHGGVAEWNAPIYKKVPHYEQRTIVDSPAVPERWEKVEK